MLTLNSHSQGEVKFLTGGEAAADADKSTSALPVAKRVIR